MLWKRMETKRKYIPDHLLTYTSIKTMKILKSLQKDKRSDVFGVFNLSFYKISPAIALCSDENHIQSYTGDYITPT